MIEKPKIGADGELETNIAFADEKPKRSDSIWRRMRHGPLIPLLVLFQTLILGVICVGGVLLLTGAIRIENPRCSVPDACTDYPPVPTKIPIETPIVIIDPTATVASADTSCDAPKTGQIAFISEQYYPFGAVYLINPDGTSECRFLQPNDGVYSIAWSPNGQSMAYVTSRGLSLMDRAGKSQDSLYIGDIDRDQIAWSPDSQWIAFAGHPPSGNNGSPEIMLINVADKNLHVLTNSPARDYSPTWSPNGKQIAFASERDGSSKIYVMNADGTDQHRLTNETGEELSPSWSLDGQYLVFSANYDSTYQLYVRDAPSGITHPFTTGGVRNSAPRFGPDNQILFVSYRDGNDELYEKNIGYGANVHRLTNNRSENYSPTWVR